MTCPCEKPCAGSNPNRVQVLLDKCDPVLFHTVELPPEFGTDKEHPASEFDYKNVLLVYGANKQAYLFSSDGIATKLTSDEAIDVADQIAELQAGQENLQTELNNEITNRLAADNELTQQLAELQNTQYEDFVELNNALGTLEDTKVQFDTAVTANGSTVTLTKTTGELGEPTEAVETALPLPVASSTQAGVMNTSTYDAVQQNSENIDSILGGAVSIDNLPEGATQEQLTDAWKAATGKDTLINRASIYDEANKLVWYYYENANEWKSMPAGDAAVSVSIATNEAPGIVQGSEDLGQIAVEADGKMSLNGYDGIQHDIENLSQLVAGIEVPKVPKFVMGSPGIAPNGDGVDLPFAVTWSSGQMYLTPRLTRFYNTADGEHPTASSPTMLSPATTTKNGVMAAADKAKLDSLLSITAIGDGLELAEDGTLSSVASGSAVNLLSEYTEEPAEGDVYDASYVNGRLDAGNTFIGKGATVNTAITSSPEAVVSIGSTASAADSSVAIGGRANAATQCGVSIGYSSQATSTYAVAIGYSARALWKDSVALGDGAKTTREMEVHIGAGSTTRYLGGLTAGVKDTDAVNLKQMQDYVAEHAGGGSQLTADEVTKVQNLGTGSLTNMDGVLQLEDSVEIEFSRQNLVAGGTTTQTATIAAATSEEAGVMSQTDKSKLDSLATITEVGEGLKLEDGALTLSAEIPAGEIPFVAEDEFNQLWEEA